MDVNEMGMRPPKTLPPVFLRRPPCAVIIITAQSLVAALPPATRPSRLDFGSISPVSSPSNPA